jgi:gamma-aminobutyric acid receptor subunit alpha
MNSVSRIDKFARIMFPASFFLLNFFYWLGYVALADEFKWREPPPSIIMAK